MDNSEQRKEKLELIPFTIYGGYGGNQISDTKSGVVVFGKLPFRYPVYRMKGTYVVVDATSKDVIEFWDKHKKQMQHRIMKEKKKNKKQMQHRIMKQGEVVSYKYRTNLADLKKGIGEKKVLKIVRFESVDRLEKNFLNPTASVLKTRLKCAYGCVYAEKNLKAAEVEALLKRQQARNRRFWSAHEKKKIMNKDKEKVVLYYLTLLTKAVEYFKLWKYYTCSTLEYILDLETKEKREQLLFYANANNCKENLRTVAPDIPLGMGAAETEGRLLTYENDKNKEQYEYEQYEDLFAPDLPLYNHVFTIQRAYESLMDENLSLWKHVYKENVVSEIEDRMKIYKTLLTNRYQSGHWSFFDKEDAVSRSGWTYLMVVDPLEGHRTHPCRAPVLKSIGNNRFMFFDDFRVVEKLCNYLLKDDRKIMVCNGGIPELDSSFQILYPNTETKEHVKSSWAPAVDDSHAKTAKSSILVAHAERWSLPLLVRRMCCHDEANKVYLHFADNIMTASDLNIASWKPAIDTMVEKYPEKFCNVDTLQIKEPIVLEEEEEMEGELSKWLKERKNKSSYVLVPDRSSKTKLLESVKDKAFKIPKGTELCKLDTEPSLYHEKRNLEYTVKNTVVVQIATIAEVSIFGGRETVYLAGGPWQKEMREKAKQLCTGKLITVRRKENCGVKSPWNYHEGEDEFKATVRESALYEVYTALHRKKQGSEQANEEANEEAAKKGHLTHLKAKAKELAERRKRTAEEAGLPITRLV